MTLNRWDPWRDLLIIQEKVSRLVDPHLHHGAAKRTFWRPAVDLVETPDAYVVKVELPGVGKENVSIQVQGRSLRLTGQRDLGTENVLAIYHTVERVHGPFERIVNVPADAQLDKAQARYVDGVLDIFIPKSDEKEEDVVTVVSLG